MFALLLFWPLACSPPEVVTIAGRSGAVEVRLVNPTTCSTCDPFETVDTLRIDVLRHGAVVASDSFRYPEEDPVLPGLDEYGVVRIQLVGLSAGVVVSAGRSDEVSVDPEGTLSVPIVFLPVNRDVPVTAKMASHRSNHVALRLRNGTVLIAGGASVKRDAAFATTEVYDPASGTFSAGPGELPGKVAEPRVVVLPEGDTMFIGGYAIGADTSTSASTAVSVFSEEAGTITATGSLAQPRAGHCVSLFRSRQGIVFGGNTDTNQADFFRSDAVGAAFTFSGVPMQNLVQGNVTGCVALADGRTFVQGSDAASTGIWNYTEETAGQIDPGNAFEPINPGAPKARFVAGEIVVPLAEGSAWIAGGADTTTGEVLSVGREFRPDSAAFADAAGLARPAYGAKWTPWMDAGLIAVGCGWQDTARTIPTGGIELLDPLGVEVGVTIALDRGRNGCSITTLNDGSLLIAGGFTDGEKNSIDAALVIPWIED